MLLGKAASHDRCSVAMEYPFRLLEEDDCYLMNITYVLRKVNGDSIRSFVSPILLTYATTKLPRDRFIRTFHAQQYQDDGMVIR